MKLASLLLGDSNEPPEVEAEVAPEEEADETGQRSRKKSTTGTLKKITANHRRFAEFLVIHNYDHIQAYVDAYQCSRATAQMRAQRLMLDPLFMKYRDSIQMPMLESIEADRAWLAQNTFQLANSNIMDYFEYKEEEREQDDAPAAEPLLKLRRLDQLAKWKQRNIKKIKVRNIVNGTGDGRVTRQEIELELYDRAAHVHKVAVALGVYGEAARDDSEMVERLVNAESRRLAMARAERERRLESGEMKEVDGVLIEQDEAT